MNWKTDIENVETNKWYFGCFVEPFWQAGVHYGGFDKNKYEQYNSNGQIDISVIAYLEFEYLLNDFVPSEYDQSYSRYVQPGIILPNSELNIIDVYGKSSYKGIGKPINSFINSGEIFYVVTKDPKLGYKVSLGFLQDTNFFLVFNRKFIEGEILGAKPIQPYPHGMKTRGDLLEYLFEHSLDEDFVKNREENDKWWKDNPEQSHMNKLLKFQ